MAGGTGDVGFRVLRAIRQAEQQMRQLAPEVQIAPGSVTVCDINPDMLQVGRQKAAAAADLAGEQRMAWQHTREQPCTPGAGCKHFPAPLAVAPSPLAEVSTREAAGPPGQQEARQVLLPWSLQDVLHVASLASAAHAHAMLLNSSDMQMLPAQAIRG